MYTFCNKKMVLKELFHGTRNIRNQLFILQRLHFQMRRHLYFFFRLNLIKCLYGACVCVFFNLGYAKNSSFKRVLRGLI